MLWINLTGLVKIKHKDFIGAAPIMLCLNSSWNNGLEDLLRRENSDFPEFICYDWSFAKDQDKPSILIFGKGPIEADEIGGIWFLPSP